MVLPLQPLLRESNSTCRDYIFIKKSGNLKFPLFLFLNFYLYLMKLLIINGPNLNLLGSREPGTYGNRNFNDYLEELRQEFSSHELGYFQSNIEGEIIDALQKADKEYEGIILNAAAYTHTSVGIGDAVKAIGKPVVEVHISNTHSREEFRHYSYIAPNAKGVILGFGLLSYKLAILSFTTSTRE